MSNDPKKLNNEYAELKYNGTVIKLPIVIGTEGEVGIDIDKLLPEFEAGSSVATRKALAVNSPSEGGLSLSCATRQTIPGLLLRSAMIQIFAACLSSFMTHGAGVY